MELQNLYTADRVVAVSAWLAQWAIDVGVPSSRVRHVPNGTSLEREGNRQAARARLGLSGLVIGFVGSHKPWHGLAALPGILDALPEATALVVGSGPTAVPHHPRLLPIGWTPPEQLADLVAAMDVGLVPYPREAPPWFCPLKAWDYRSQGVPVVAADHPSTIAGADVVVRDEVHAWAAAIREAVGRVRRREPRSWSVVVREAAGDWL
jgi:glycosyltransferase involved in cell wall biosynthesis